jgi:hypothetical protein
LAITWLSQWKRATEEEKLAHWRTVVGPVFQAIWPLDVELQTSATTFKHVQILLATGEAFPEACDIPNNGIEQPVHLFRRSQIADR